MFGIFVRCPDGFIEMPYVADSEWSAHRKVEDVARDPNWYGPENVWCEEIEETTLAQ
jgi:hypothetical protein